MNDHDVSNLPPFFQLSRMIMSVWIPQAIHAAAELGVADELVLGPKSGDDLAKALSTDPDATYRLLRGLALLGLVSEAADGTFALTALGEPLRADAPDSVRSWALLMGGQGVWGAWGQLAECVRTGEDAWRRAGTSAFQVMDERSDESAIFNQAMLELTRRAAPAIAVAYDFGRHASVVDVGGGWGTLLAGVLDAHPSTRGIVFDLAHVRDGAERLIEERALGTRAEFVAGDFFASVPQGAEAYLLKSIIHDWDDDRSVAILRNCRDAMAEGGRVLVVEPLAPERNQLGESPSDRILIASDLNMLVNTGGRERTEREFRELFAAAGLRLERIVPVPGTMPLMELVRA